MKALIGFVLVVVGCVISACVRPVINIGTIGIALMIVGFSIWCPMIKNVIKELNESYLNYRKSLRKGE